MKLNEPDNRLADLTEGQATKHWPAHFLLHGDPSDCLDIEGYKPNRHELRVLARFWADVWFDIDTYMFSFGYEQCGRCRWDARAYASSRLADIADVGGVDLINDALKAAKHERRQREEDPVFWELYEQGDVEGWLRICPLFREDDDKSRASDGPPPVTRQE
jgi:hypothetical protein